MAKESVKIKIPRHLTFNYTFLSILFKNRITLFLCALVIFPFFIEPVSASTYNYSNTSGINQTLNNLTNDTSIICLSNFTLVNNTCIKDTLSYHINNSCIEKFSYLNGTCIESMTIFNQTTYGKEFKIEVNHCANISCNEGYYCSKGKCLLNLSYSNVDSKVIELLSEKGTVYVNVVGYKSIQCDYFNEVKGLK